jgi:PBP1b-binding outer membrane lipoprotein LpoB
MRYMMLIIVAVFLAACGDTAGENDTESEEAASINLQNVNVILPGGRGRECDYRRSTLVSG